MEFENCPLSTRCLSYCLNPKICNSNIPQCTIPRKLGSSKIGIQSFHIAFEIWQISLKYRTTYWISKQNKYSCLHFHNYDISQDHIHDLAQDCGNSSALALELLQSCTKPLIDDLAQDCCNSSALALELPQSCTKPSIWEAHTESQAGCPAVREKSGKFQTWQKSGKSQGILLKVRGKMKSQGKVREFAFSAI